MVGRWSEPVEPLRSRVEPTHLSELTGLPCRYCMIPATDAKRGYEQCPAVPRAERERRIAAQDYSKGRAKREIETVKLVQADSSRERASDQGLTDQSPRQETRDQESDTEGTDAGMPNVQVPSEQTRAQSPTEEMETRAQAAVMKRRRGQRGKDRKPRQRRRMK